MHARGPVVAILGHVDHGKTSLLDYIRKSRVVSKEAGGITQKIGAYEVETGIKEYKASRITFIDTPGHEAFTKIRSRGANVADIAVLIVDGKDSIMPQTIESITHIKASKIPFIVAINKCDLPDFNATKVERDLLKHQVQTESQGGNVLAIPISAKTGKNVDTLLDAILLLASEKKLRYQPTNPAHAVIVETTKDKRGIVATIIIQDGVLKTGDTLYTASGTSIKVRAMITDTGAQVREAHPSTPLQILGFNEQPEVGTTITSEKPEQDQSQKAAVQESTQPTFDLAEILKPKVVEKKLSVIIKADSQGSLEAILSSVALNNKIEVVMATLGDIHRSDVFLAKTTSSIIIGFNSTQDAETTNLAHSEKVVIKTYKIIYELLEELDEVTDLIAEKEAAARNLKGEAKVAATFVIDQEKVYGLSVHKGKFSTGDMVSVMRNSNVYGKTKIITIKHKAKTINEVKKGEECGMLFSPALDIRAGDVIQCIL